MNFPPVIVTWNDAWGEDSQEAVENLPHTPVVTYSIGFLVYSDGVGVTIAMDKYEDSKKEVRNHTFIPRGMITDLKYLGEGYD